MSTTAFALTDDFGERPHGAAPTAVARRLRLQLPGDVRPTARVPVQASLMAPDRVTLARWMTTGKWVEFSRGGDLPVDWVVGARDTRCANCGASASTSCSLACPARLLTSSDECHAVQAPCEFHRPDAAAAGDDCPHCTGGLATVAWATIEFAPMRIVGYRYRVRRSKPNQFKLFDGSYHDVHPGVEPICLPGRWARGGSIEATSMWSSSQLSGATASA